MKFNYGTSMTITAAFWLLYFFVFRDPEITTDTYARLKLYGRYPEVMHYIVKAFEDGMITQSEFREIQRLKWKHIIEVSNKRY